MIPYGRQDISQADVDAVVEVLRSDWLTQGPMVPKFEQTVAEYVGAQYGIAVNSATSALHIACLALGVGPGDTVWTSPNTFVASANAALYCGAKVDFVDIDPRTFNISIEALDTKLHCAKRSGDLPKVVIPVHFAGQACDMPSIKNLSKKYGFKIIEDASHAIGAGYLTSGESWNGIDGVRDCNKDHFVKIGACSHSDVTVFSFHPVKVITTGEGGMCLTNDKEVLERIRLLRSHGICRDSARMGKLSDGPWVYQQVELGYNYRMTDIQAALGLSQLRRIDQYVEKRHEIANQYDKLLKDFPIELPWRDPIMYSSLHLYVIRLKLEKISLSKRRVFEIMREKGIGVNVHYIPVHTQPFYKKLGFKKGDFPDSERYYEEAISLPIYPGLADSQQVYIVNELKNALKI